MKKTIFICLLCFIAVFSAFSEEPVITEEGVFTTEEIIGEENDIMKMEVTEKKDKLVTIRIEYYPALDEARFIYKVPSSLFDKGEAMNYLQTVIADFRKEHGYYSHKHLQEDVTKFDNENKMAIYTSFIKLGK